MSAAAKATAAAVGDTTGGKSVGLFYRIIAHDATQMLLYVIYIILFQLISTEMRRHSEYFTTKYINDVLLEAPFSEWENPEDVFMGIGEIVDVYDFGDNVLWPGLFQDTYPHELSTDGGGQPIKYTPTELAANMDRFDWTSGISFNQLRVRPMAEDRCDSHRYSRFARVVEDVRARLLADDADSDEFSEAGEEVTVSTRHYLCLPDLEYSGEGGTGEQDTRPFGYNASDPSRVRDVPFLHYTAEQQGTNPAGQPSASVEVDFNSIPTDGFPSFVIPFFSDTFLPEEFGNWSDVTDFRLFSHNVSRTPAYFCVRMSWNGEHIRQLCDPNDALGRTTGVVPAAVLEFWDDMKRAHYIDAQTRAITITLPLRNNNAGVRFRLTMLLQITSVGAVVPSFDIESRNDSEDVGMLERLFLATLFMTVYFGLMEVEELRLNGFFGYFSNMWNLMDATNFFIYALLVMNHRRTKDALGEYSCDQICQQVGFYDPWKILMYTTNTKQALAIITTVQWIKVIKFVNRFVPKVSLATSVLSHALADLLLFLVVFMWSIFSFAQLFYMQLGPYMRGYSSLMLAMLTLFRSLFGDFDIQAIVDSSNSYLNMFFFLGYLFFAVFILLSIFLTILGEHQDELQTEMIEKRERARRAGEKEFNEWGVLGELKDAIQHYITKAGTKASSARAHMKGDSLHKLEIPVETSVAAAHWRRRAKHNAELRTEHEATARARATKTPPRTPPRTPPLTPSRGNADATALPRQTVQEVWRGGERSSLLANAAKLAVMTTTLQGEVRAFEAGFVSEHGRAPTDAEMAPVAGATERLKAIGRLEQLLVELMADGALPPTLLATLMRI